MSPHAWRTARRFASDTGWPPPELLVTVTNTTGTSRSASTRRSASTSMLPLNGWRDRGHVRPRGSARSRASAPVNSTFARVVSKWVLFGIVVPGPCDRAEEDLLGRAALVGGDHVLEREQLLHGVEEAKPRARAGVALVAAVDARPTARRTSSRCRSRSAGRSARLRPVADEEVAVRIRSSALSRSSRRRRGESARPRGCERAR